VISKNVNKILYWLIDIPVDLLAPQSPFLILYYLSWNNWALLCFQTPYLLVALMSTILMTTTHSTPNY